MSRRQRSAAAVAILGAVVAVLCGVPPESSASPTPPTWMAWRSSPYDVASRLAADEPSSAAATLDLHVSTGQTGQTWRGVGAALTDASAGILRGSGEATSVLYDPSRADGAHLNLVRLPLTATDFSTSGWTFGWNDATNQLTVPVIATSNAAFVAGTLKTLRPDLRAVAVPWTAPAAMKTPAALNGGSLASASVPAYGRMLVAEADWLAQQGVPLEAMTLGNEPFHAALDYPTMLMSDSQMIALAQQVGPALASRGVSLWSIDHNWEHRSDYDAVQAGAPGMFSAAAFHCYGGQVTQMLGVQPAPVMTECTGTTDGFPGTFAWDMQNLVVSAIDSGSTGLLMWNLALDENHGPRLGGCSNCRGVIDVDSGTGAITRGPEFYTLAHVARAADPGAVVLARTPVNGMPYAAFRNPDGTIGVVGHNNTGAPQTIEAIVDGVTGERFDVQPGDLFTLRSVATKPAISNGVQPSILGPAKVGSALTADPGTWSPADASLAITWSIAGQPVATGPQYVVPASAVGKRIAVTVAATKSGWTGATASSAPTPAVVPGTFSVMRAPGITGTARVGSVLAYRAATLIPSATGRSIRWRRDGVAIPGATGATYHLVAADRGRRIALTVTYRRPGYVALRLRTAGTARVR